MTIDFASFSRRRMLQILAAIPSAAGAAGASTLAWGASDFPNGPITIIVPNPPGLADALTRALAQGLSTRFKLPIPVVNRPGAASQVGTRAVTLAAPDGYTLLMGTSVPLAELPVLSTSVPYKFPEDFSFVSLVSAGNPWVVSSSTNLKARTLADVVEYAKANPGRVRYGSVGVGSGGQMAMSLLEEATGAKFTHIPYAGGVPVATAVLAGEIDVGVTGVGTMLQHARSDRVRLLAVTATKRSSYFPEVPTTVECGYPSMVNDIWWGIVGPAGVPQPIRQRLAQEIKEAMQDEVFTKMLVAWGLEPAWLGPEDFSRFATDYLKLVRAFAETPAGQQMKKEMAR
jgi:tripartite-type tricarboxylate transporter receptor subunit TctC